MSDDNGSCDDSADEYTLILRQKMSSSPRPSTPPGSTSHVYLVGTVAAIGGLLFGYDTGVVSGALLWIPKDIPLTFAQESMVVSITVLFCAVFSIVAGVLSDLIGRRRTIMIAGCLFIIGSAMLAFAPNLGILLAGRAVVGAGVGMASMMVPPYIAECSPLHLRGRMVLVFQLLITFGQFAASIIAGILSMPWADPGHVGWRIMLAIAAIPAIIQLLAFLVMPESPRWLVEHDRIEEAKKVIAKMYTTDEWRDYELEEIVREHKETTEARAEQSRSGGSSNTLWLILTTPHVRRALLVGCSLQAFQQLAGVNTLMYFTATIIKMSGIGNAENAIWLSCLASGTNFLFTGVPIVLIERLGRRKLLLVSTGAVIGSLLLLAGGFLAIHDTAPTVTSTVNESMSYVEGGWTGHCAGLSLCDDCVTSEHCGYCQTANSSFCLPVDIDSDKSVSWVGECDNKTILDSTNRVWQYDFCKSNYSWLVLVGMLVYLFSFTVGMGPIPWVLNAEIYPNWARGTAVSIATATNWSFNFLISETFLQLTILLNKHGVFVLYAGITTVAFILFYFFVPETSGVPTEQVPLLFQTKRTNKQNRPKLQHSQ